jgi:hypothetical protein
METRTIDILDYGFLNASIIESVVLFPYKLFIVLSCAGCVFPAPFENPNMDRGLLDPLPPGRIFPTQSETRCSLATSEYHRPLATQPL